MLKCRHQCYMYFCLRLTNFILGPDLSENGEMKTEYKPFYSHLIQKLQMEYFRNIK